MQVSEGRSERAEMEDGRRPCGQDLAEDSAGEGMEELTTLLGF